MRTAKIGPDLRLPVCPWVYQTFNEDDFRDCAIIIRRGGGLKN